MKILIADDSDLSRRLLRRALETWSYEVVEAEDGNQAWRVLNEEDSPRLAILDRYMPGMEGLEVCRRVRERLESPYVYTIILTIKHDRRSLMEGFESGADDFLGKPFDPLELECRLRAGVRLVEMEDRLRAAHATLHEKNGRLAQLCETAQKFVDNVSHEFRTPLTVIKEYVSLLREGYVGEVTLDDEQNRFLNIVADRADDLNIMVDDMLDVSKHRAGLLNAWRRRATIEGIVEHVRPALEKKALVKDVRLETEIPADLPAVCCDSEKAGRVITNLAINAIKFSGQPGLVKIWARQEPHQLRVGVTDNGPGIEKQALAEVFQRFKQLDTHTRSSCKGFGLGLNIAKELVDLNFGEMHVESEVGAGSTFSFTLPLDDPRELVDRYLTQLSRRHGLLPPLAMITACAEVDGDSRIGDEVEAMLHYLQQGDELLMRVDKRTWLIITPTVERSAAECCAKLQAGVAETNRNRPQGELPSVHLDIEGDWAEGEDKSKVTDVMEELLLEPVRG